ncbi:unnamed protein product [Parascedosporium putredinis]|uniref:Uncharacterized protein n=1 Tax=Parascedosporium putredinis TaxID=1442378 RepID=A0A9P1M897_9PEZI|nr:unnamed protein product [Parascedosporium putredinis]CAI7989485.1 unnamed protein product [Parascedosporium putredinis]
MAEPQERSKITPLSAWDQSSSRFHIRLVLNFELDDSKRKEVAAHLGSVLKRLSAERPDLAGRLHVNGEFDGERHGERPGWIYLRESPDFDIPLEIVNVEDKVRSFQDLKADSFPAKDFIDPLFGYTGPSLFCGLGVPAAVVRRTRANGVTSERQPSFHQLLKKCPEYVELSKPMGPNQPTLRPGGESESTYVKDGKIFVLRKEKIRKLKELVMHHAPAERLPSSYICLSTLFWVFAANSRMRSEEDQPSWESHGRATMTNPVNWRFRAFQEENKGYYGNSAALAQMVTSVQEVSLAAHDWQAYARLVRASEDAIRNVNEKFVRRRTRLFEAAPNPRFLGLYMDPRIPQDLAFNTWRDFGADTLWDLCGTGSNGSGIGGGIVKPDSLRRSQDSWNMGGTLILPARGDSDLYEVLLTIPKPAMDQLKSTERFMRWIDRVLD